MEINNSIVEALLNEEQAAAFLGIKEATLKTLRQSKGINPPVPHSWIGRHLRYVRSELLQWAIKQDEGARKRRPKNLLNNNGFKRGRGRPRKDEQIVGDGIAL